MSDSVRGVHVSPGVYTKETDINYAVKSLGVTTLGLVGETQKGPAFEPTRISDWDSFKNVFGGTSAEKFIGSQYPKYELPYIAKSYLTESKQLDVVRVLGFSGYNAGPAWIVKGAMGQIICVIRSRGSYKGYVNTFSKDNPNDCECYRGYDNLFYNVGEISSTTSNAKKCSEPRSFNMNALSIKPYTSVEGNKIYCDSYNLNSTSATSIDVSTENMGRFKIIGINGSCKETDSADAMYSSASTRTSGYFEIPVSLNPGDNDYILKVLGTSPNDGDTPVYVESLYDIAWNTAINDGESQISPKLEVYDVKYTSEYGGIASITGILTKQENELRRKDVGKRYLAIKSSTDSLGNKIQAHAYNYKTKKPLVYEDASQVSAYTPSLSTLTVSEAEKLVGTPLPAIDIEIGRIYTVAKYTDKNGSVHYYYKHYTNDIPFSTSKSNMLLASAAVSTGSSDDSKLGTTSLSSSEFMDVYDRLIPFSESSGDVEIPIYTYDKQNYVNGYYPAGNGVVVYNNEDGLYWKIQGSGANADCTFVSCDLNNYKSMYRYSSTPWIVSNVKGDATHINLNKMFRFHTISDGDSSCNEIKISIENVMPDEGTFDVCVRDINDTDGSPTFLEKFGNCNMVPGDGNYIGYKIGTVDGEYESKSNYITVEVSKTTAAKNSVPAGFMGYPVPCYNGNGIDDTQHEDVIYPNIAYNKTYYEEIKNRKQYFGLSNLSGVDIDMFTFKGNMAYVDDPHFLSSGFHLDCRASKESYENSDILFTVDGESGYTFDTVSVSERTQNLTENPIIDTEEQMAGSIYENKNLRKFTVYFYGGFDGFDIYREERTNGDEFKYSSYKGVINAKSGEGYSFNSFSTLTDGGTYQITGNAITSDYYAFLAGIRQFSNPSSTDINLFATPGIDIENNTELVKEAFDMVEEERGDTFYVACLPDKPAGASDSEEEIYTADDEVGILEDSNIESSYGSVYYPWVKYKDVENNQYIYLPPTKDVVRNMAMGDNQNASAGLAPAGMNRGSVTAVMAHIKTKIEDEDTLYGNNINPVKTFAQDGIKIWGQKTLLTNGNPADRIDVRRSLLQLRKLISIASLQLIFEPNDNSIKKEVESLIKPILNNFVDGRSLRKYTLKLSQSEEERENHEVSGVIGLLFNGAFEYLNLNFMIAKNNATFSQI